MPYIEISEEQLKEFDPEGKLNIYTPEDTSGLKATANDLLGEKKRLELELSQTMTDLKASKMERYASGSGDDATKLQSQLDDAMNKIKDWEGKYTNLQEDVRAKTIEAKAQQIASSMTSDTQRANLLKQQIIGRITLDNDNFAVLDEKGNQTISSIDELTGQIKAQYPFLVDGSQASGGGAKGGSGGAASTKKYGDYTAAELSAVNAENPDEYQRLLSTR